MEPLNNKSNSLPITYRPKTRGELLDSLRAKVLCEVVASNEEITSILLRGWLKFSDFKTYPSHNEGWVIYEFFKPDVV